MVVLGCTGVSSIHNKGLSPGKLRDEKSCFLALVEKNTEDLIEVWICGPFHLSQAPRHVSVGSFLNAGKLSTGKDI